MNKLTNKKLVRSLTLLFLMGSFWISCNEGTQEEDATIDYQKVIQEQLINAKEGDLIEIPEGTFEFTRSISLDGISNVTIKGAGIGKTILSFKNQIEGAEGLKITANNVTITDLTVQDTKGDAVKVQDSEGVTLRNVEVTWTNGPDSANGAYGIYPVSCKKVLIEGCRASCASDAGIYVGQSVDVIIRNCVAYKNVAGIEIENCINAEAYENEAYENSAGILLFDLPELPLKNGHHISLHHNIIRNNNYPNFSPLGNTVALIPSGTGILIMSTRQVDVFENEITDHITTSMALVSYLITQKPFKDSLYNPFSSGIYIHNNNFAQAAAMPDTTRPLGKLIAELFGGETPEIVYDGMINPQLVNEDGSVMEEARLCIRDNGKIRFANINAATGFQNIQTDIENYNCQHASFARVEL